MYKVSEVVGSGGEGVFSAVLWPLAAWLYICELLLKPNSHKENRNTKDVGEGLLGKRGFPGSWREWQGYEIHHTCKTVSEFKVFSDRHARCGLGPGLLTDVLRFKAGECTSCQPLPSPSLRLCPATLQLHRPPSPKAHKPVLLCVLSLPAPSKDRKARPTCCSWL